MNRIVALVLIVFVLHAFLMPQQVDAAADSEGKTLFRDYCKACHTIGKGKLVGPDLKDIDKKRNEVWLKKWIKSSKSLIDAKDPDAVAIFHEFNQVPMTEFPNLTDAQITTILDYIKVESNPVLAQVTDPASPPASQVNTAKESNWLTMPMIFLLSIIFLLLYVIYHLSRMIKQLTTKLGNAYIDNRSFF